jgi:tight adherence protein B
VGIDVMLRDFGERSGTEDILSFADVFGLCFRKGGDINMIVRQTHAAMSEKMSIMEEIRTKLASNKMQHNIMSVMPVVIILMLRATNPAFAESFATPAGVLANMAGMAIFVASYFIGRKIVDIKT